MLLSVLLHETRSTWTITFDTSCLAVVVFTSWLWIRRRQTRLLLEAFNLPTVYWTPRFINYIPKADEGQKMNSSSITGILPRMERLGGPFGMYGTVYGISTPVVHVAHPLPAKCILMGNDVNNKRRMSITETSGACKAPAYNHFQNFSGTGVFTADGTEWKEKRASVIHCMLRGISSPTSPAFQRLEREANYAAESFITELKSMRRHGDEVETNVVPILQRATIGLIYRFITHDESKSNQLEGSDRGYVEGLKSASSSSSSLCSMATPTSDTPPDDMSKTKASADASFCPPNLLQAYLSSVTDIRMIILAQSRSFWYLLPRWIYRAFSFMYQEEERTMGPIRSFAKRACQQAQPGSPLALLCDRPSHSSTNGVSQHLIDEAITLLFAGQDTSAATLSWTLHLLSINLDVQKRLAEEVRLVLREARANTDEDCEESSSELPLTKKLVSKMPLLDAVIKESMRLYPVAPFVVRRLQYDLDVVEGDTTWTRLPSGAFACVWIYALHRNPKLWARPNDFVPDRWINPSVGALDAGQKMVGAYMPFAAGPRSCLGQPLANVILRIALARIIHQFQFEDRRLKEHRCDPTTLRKDMQAGFTVLPAGGLELLVSTRARVE